MRAFGPPGGVGVSESSRVRDYGVAAAGAPRVPAEAETGKAVELAEGAQDKV